jgi:replicative DNA helicase
MIATVEESVAKVVGEAHSSVPPIAVPIEAIFPKYEADKFKFDEAFQTKIMALSLRDFAFMQKVGHLLKAEYFDDSGEGAMVDIATSYYAKYRDVPTKVATVELFKSATTTRKITPANTEQAKNAFRIAFAAGTTAEKPEHVGILSDSSFVAENVAEFARQQSMTQAIYNSVELVDSRKFDKIEAMIKAANAVGINNEPEDYDYFAKITERSEDRRLRASGFAPISGITTGLKLINDLLYHRGWGRKELTVIMGGAKAGKTTALINFAKAAVQDGKNVLYVTLEVAASIISSRLDAALTSTPMRELDTSLHSVEAKVTDAATGAGKLKIAEYPPNSFTPDDLSRLIEKYKSPQTNRDGTVREAIIFDMVVVDYADIMAPNHRTNDSIENSKNVWLDVRAVAVRENLALLTATQTNREGFKSTVARAEHIADDFNKVRTADLLISINITDEERAEGVCRLFFAASRNQEGGFTVFVKQELAKMLFATHVIKVE